MHQQCFTQKAQYSLETNYYCGIPVGVQDSLTPTLDTYTCISLIWSCYLINMVQNMNSGCFTPTSSATEELQTILGGIVYVFSYFNFICNCHLLIIPCTHMSLSL